MAIEESSNAVRKWFTDHDWTFDETKLDDGAILFTMGVAADPPIFKGYDVCIVCRERDVQPTFTLPAKIPPSHPKMAKRRRKRKGAKAIIVAAEQSHPRQRAVCQ